MELEFFEQLNLLHRRLHQRADRIGRSRPLEVLGQRARVSANPQRRRGLLRLGNDFAHLVGATNIAGIDAHRSHASVHRTQCQRGVEVDVGNNRHCALGDDARQCVNVGQPRHGDADNIDAGIGEARDLRERRVGIKRLRRRHRLHGNLGATANQYATHIDLSFACHLGKSTPALRTGEPADVVVEADHEQDQDERNANDADTLDHDA